MAFNLAYSKYILRILYKDKVSIDEIILFLSIEKQR